MIQINQVHLQRWQFQCQPKLKRISRNPSRVIAESMLIASCKSLSKTVWNSELKHSRCKASSSLGKTLVKITMSFLVCLNLQMSQIDTITRMRPKKSGCHSHFNNKCTGLINIVPKATKLSKVMLLTTRLLQTPPHWILYSNLGICRIKERRSLHPWIIEA